MKSELIDGKRCITMTENELKIARMTVVMLWLAVITLLAFGISFLVFFTGGLRSAEGNIIDFVENMPNPRTYTISGLIMFMVSVIQMIALVQLTTVVFKAKKNNGKLCIEMSDNDLALTKIGITVMWVSIGVAVVPPMVSLLTGHQPDVVDLDFVDYTEL
jgi:signal transduction histidine kinase